jgi:hypothetical protein
MKIGYLRKTQLYIMIICFIVLGNGFLMHYSYQEILQDIQDQKLSHAYAHQLVILEDAMVERSALYKQYIAHPKSSITLADLQLTEQKIKTILARLMDASTGAIWDEPLRKLKVLNQKFTGGATELVRASEMPIASGKAKSLLSVEVQKEALQKFAEQIDTWDLVLKNYIAKLRQIADQADQLAAAEIHKQRQFCVLLNMMACLIIVGLLVLIYVWVGYRLRRSIVNLTCAMQDYSLFGVNIPVLKGDRNSEMGRLSLAAESFKGHVMENIMTDFRAAHPGLFKEVEQFMVASRELKVTVNGLLDAYDNRGMETNNLMKSNEQTRQALRSFIKNGETFLETARESNSFGKNKKMNPHLESLTLLVEEARQAITKELDVMAKIESRQKRIFELLLALSIKMGDISEQLEKELSLFIQASRGSGDTVIINRR